MVPVVDGKLFFDVCLSLLFVVDVLAANADFCCLEQVFDYLMFGDWVVRCAQLMVVYLHVVGVVGMNSRYYDFCYLRD